MIEDLDQRIQEAIITYCVCDFLFDGYPCKPTEDMMSQCQKNMGFNLLISDSPI